MSLPRLLLLEPRMLGDAAMCLPFVRAAATRYEVHVVCTPAAVPLLARVLPPAQLIPWHPPWLEGHAASGETRGVMEFAGVLRARHPHAAASVWPDVRLHLLLALSGAPVRAGFPMTEGSFYASHLPWRKRQLRRGRLAGKLLPLLLFKRLLTLPVAPDPATPHHVDRFRVLASALDLPWNASPPWLTSDPAALPEEMQRLAAEARTEGRRLWVVHPGGRVPEQRWPLDRFRQVVRDGLLARGDRVVAIPTAEVPGDAWREDGVPVVETPSLDALLATLDAADAVLCNDTGISHFAAALGKPVTAIFSASEPRWFAPWGSAPRVVRREVCPHHPCLGRCVMPTPICRDAVTTDDVLAALDALGPAPHQP